MSNFTKKYHNCHVFSKCCTTLKYTGQCNIMSEMQHLLDNIVFHWLSLKNTTIITVFGKCHITLNYTGERVITLNYTGGHVIALNYTGKRNITLKYTTIMLITKHYTGNCQNNFIYIISLYAILFFLNFYFSEHFLMTLFFSFSSGIEAWRICFL